MSYLLVLEVGELIAGRLYMPVSDQCLSSRFLKVLTVGEPDQVYRQPVPFVHNTDAEEFLSCCYLASRFEQLEIIPA